MGKFKPVTTQEIEHLKFVEVVNRPSPGAGKTRTKIGGHPANARMTRRLVKRGLMSMDAEGYTSITKEGKKVLGIEEE